MSHFFSDYDQWSKGFFALWMAYLFSEDLDWPAKPFLHLILFVSIFLTNAWFVWWRTSLFCEHLVYNLQIHSRSHCFLLFSSSSSSFSRLRSFIYVLMPSFTITPHFLHWRYPSLDRNIVRESLVLACSLALSDWLESMQNEETMLLDRRYGLAVWWKPGRNGFNRAPFSSFYSSSLSNLRKAKPNPIIILTSFEAIEEYRIVWAWTGSTLWIRLNFALASVFLDCFHEDVSPQNSRKAFDRIGVVYLRVVSPSFHLSWPPLQNEMIVNDRPVSLPELNSQFHVVPIGYLSECSNITFPLSFTSSFHPQQSCCVLLPFESNPPLWHPPPLPPHGYSAL